MASQRMNFLSFKDSTRKLAAADSIAIIGFGRFSTALALELMETGTEVLGGDVNEDIVQALNGRLTQVVRADSTRLETLEQLTIGEFDRVAVAVGSDIKVSVLTASLLLQLGSPWSGPKPTTSSTRSSSISSARIGCSPRNGI